METTKDFLNNAQKIINNAQKSLSKEVNSIRKKGVRKSIEFGKLTAFAIRHPIASEAIGMHFQEFGDTTDISSNTFRLARLGGIDTPAVPILSTGKDLKGGDLNAFRHVLWQATITAEFDATIAKAAGDAHEINLEADLDMSKRKFKDLDLLDETIDFLNNSIGRAIGDQHQESLPKELAKFALEEFKNEGFYTGVEQPDGTYHIEKTKLSEETYIKMIERLKEVDENGMNPK